MSRGFGAGGSEAVERAAMAVAVGGGDEGGGGGDGGGGRRGSYVPPPLAIPLSLVTVSPSLSRVRGSTYRSSYSFLPARLFLSPRSASRFSPALESPLASRRADREGWYGRYGLLRGIQLPFFLSGGGNC